MTRPKILALSALVFSLLGSAAMTPGCTQKDSPSEGAPPVDTEIMAFLSEARALHHQANLAEEGGDVPGAVHAMERLVAARRPHADRRTPEIEEVLADAFARIAELHLKKGELEAARSAVKSGLEHVADATYFRGHLLEVDGLVEEARSAQLADAGRAAEAKLARERAILLLEEVVKIQDQVIQRSLADGSTEAGR